MRTAGLFIFPWDFADEGVEPVIDAVRDLGITRLYLASVYHAGWFMQPHNPKRKVRMVEDGVAYFHADLSRYEAMLKPKIAAMCAKTDWFGVACEAAQKRGLEVCAWTVCLHNSRAGALFPECTVQNVYGDSYPHALTPGHYAVRSYLRGIVSELAERYGLHSIFLEGVDYRGRRHGHHHERHGVHLQPLEQRLMDLCFNPADVKTAQSQGVDVETLRRGVRAHLDQVFAAVPEPVKNLPRTIEEFRAACPPMAAYEASLHRTEQSLVNELHQDALRHGVALEGVGDHPAYQTRVIGAYGESPERVASLTREAKAALHENQELGVLIRIGFDGPDMGRPLVSQELTESVTLAAVENGADVVGYYNYSEAPRKSLAWIKSAIAAARSRSTARTAASVSR